MKKLMLSFCLIPSLSIFSGITENIELVWDLRQAGGTELAIGFLTEFLEEPNLSEEEKMKYLYTRSMFHLFNNDKENAMNDFKKFKEICLNFDSCDLNYWINNYPIPIED